MTKDDIIRMALEAGELKCDCCLPYYEETDIEGFEGFLERFAALVAAAYTDEIERLHRIIAAAVARRMTSLNYDV